MVKTDLLLLVLPNSVGDCMDVRPSVKEKVGIFISNYSSSQSANQTLVHTHI